MNCFFSIKILPACSLNSYPQLVTSCSNRRVTPLALSHQVSQGSLLGPQLFLLYQNLTSFQLDELPTVGDGDILQRPRVAVDGQRLQLLHQRSAVDNMPKHNVHTVGQRRSRLEQCQITNIIDKQLTNALFFAINSHT